MTAVDPEMVANIFEGEVAALPIAELLQFLYISGKDGVLVISENSGKPRSVIHYAQSTIVHVRMFEELRLLVRTQWIAIESGREAFDRLAQE